MVFAELHLVLALVYEVDLHRASVLVIYELDNRLVGDEILKIVDNLDGRLISAKQRAMMVLWRRRLLRESGRPSWWSIPGVLN